MTAFDNASPPPAEPDRQQDEEAEERFDDESLAGTPDSRTDSNDPEDAKDEQNDEA
jgi:hypothetical protein